VVGVATVTGGGGGAAGCSAALLHPLTLNARANRVARCGL